MHLSLEVLHLPLPNNTTLKGTVELPPPVTCLLRGKEELGSSSASDSNVRASASPLGENVWHGPDSERRGSRNANLFVCLTACVPPGNFRQLQFSFLGRGLTQLSC